MTEAMMTAQEFDLAADVAHISGRTRDALRAAYVEGLTVYAAARKIGVRQQVLYRAVPRLRRACALLDSVRINERTLAATQRC